MVTLIIIYRNIIRNRKPECTCGVDVTITLGPDWTVT